MLDELPAPDGSHVSVHGTPTGDELSVTGWAPDPGPDELYRYLRGVHGVPRDALPDLDAVAAEATIIGSGGGTTRSGGWWRDLHVAWLTEEIRRRVTELPAGSVYVHGFVRDAGLPALLSPDS